MLITMLIALSLLVALAAACFAFAERNFLAGIIGTLSAATSVVGLIFCLVAAFEWHGAAHQADIMNREYGTSYTQAEVFFASRVIETVRELDRKRVEINGNVLKD